MKEADLKLLTKKSDIERGIKAQHKKELMEHKQKIESIYRSKLDEEKRSMLKGRVDEIDRLMKENKRLNAKLSKGW